MSEESMRDRRREKAEGALEEHQQNQAKEEKLTEVSKLSYDEVDYSQLLERKKWVEAPLPDLGSDFLAARSDANKEFKGKIVTRLILPILILLGLPLLASQVTLWIAIADGLLIVVLLYMTVSDWQTKLRLLRKKAEEDILRQKTEVLTARNEAKKLFEQNETERIALFSRVMKGEIAAVIMRLDNVLKRLNLPFVVNIEVDIFGKIPHIKVWPPPKSVVPMRRSFVNEKGEVEYENKDLREINKQYLEIFAATIMRVVSVIYGNVPSFDKGYVSGMLKDGGTDICLLNFTIEDREMAKRICRASNGSSAVQQSNAKIEYDNMLNMLEQDLVEPEEWKGVEQNKIKTLMVKAYK